MVSIEEIDKAIIELEKHDTSYATCERLAWLFIVRDHINTREAAYQQEILGANDRTEFLEAISYKEAAAVMEIIAEHMECIKLLHPREYAAIIKKIKEIE